MLRRLTQPPHIAGPLVQMEQKNWPPTKYRNGNAIATTSADIVNETAPNYQWAYGGNESNVATYGRLYTWYAVNDSRKICPTWWHVPTESEWTTLTNYLTNNGFGFEGSGDDIAKSMASTSGWTTISTAGSIGNNQLSNNSSGFTAIPSGYRYTNGTFYNLGTKAYWWSSTPTSPESSMMIYLENQFSIVFKNGDGNTAGYSVRCIKD